VLDAVAGNKTTAAKTLGIDRNTLYRRLKQYGIED
jgi:transcriptional regulator of acetoin/glycerol metabolism